MIVTLTPFRSRPHPLHRPQRHPISLQQPRRHPLHGPRKRDHPHDPRHRRGPTNLPEQQQL